MDKHYHWTFVAYDGEPNADTIRYGVKVTVLGYENEEMARMAARDLIKREQFALTDVYECNTCAFQKNYTKAVKEMTDKLP